MCRPVISTLRDGAHTVYHDPLNIPQAIKDLANARGIRTTWGSPLFKDFVATEDSIHVARMRAAGALMIGKTNTPEFGAGANTRNAVYGATGNTVKHVWIAGEQVLREGKLTKVDHDEIMRQVGVTSQRIAARLDMKKVVKLLWPVE